MILFKRIGESFRHIEDREWVLLFLETLGVVAGILIAFELNEWAQRRSAAAKHREMMERLFEESEQDVSTTRDLRDVMLQLGSAEAKFATAISRGECPPAELWNAVGTVTVLPSFNVPRSVYDELMGAGGLSSIEDQRVRNAIKIFNSQLNWSEGQNSYFRTVHLQPLAPSDQRVHLLFDAQSEDMETARYDRARLCADPGFRNRMIEATATHLKAVSFHKQLTQLAITMCGTIGASLGHTCAPAFGDPLSREDTEILRRAVRQMR